MTDYYAILRPAILALDPNKKQNRLDIYNRARKLIADRSEVMNGALPAPDLFKELYFLEVAIKRIEEEFLEPAAPEEALTAELEEPETKGEVPPERPRPKLVVKLLVIGLIVCAVSVGGMIGLRYWADKSSGGSRYLGGPQAQRELVEVRDGILRGDELPYTLRRQLVYYRTTYPLGTLIISKSQKYLYLVRPNVAALRYSIGIGRKCSDSVGLYRVSQKEKWAGWKEAMQGSASTSVSAAQTENPLGAGVLHLENENQRIHGISKAIGFGSALGCFQLINDDIADLIDRVPVGTRVVATN